MKREKNIYQSFHKTDQSWAKKLLKNRVVRITKFEELEYIITFEGRCMSYRSRGKIASLRLRNSKYGVEQRVFVHNPRLSLES
jgi:ribosomal protein L19